MNPLHVSCHLHNLCPATFEIIHQHAWPCVRPKSTHVLQYVLSHNLKTVRDAAVRLKPCHYSRLKGVRKGERV